MCVLYMFVLYLITVTDPEGLSSQPDTPSTPTVHRKPGTRRRKGSEKFPYHFLDDFGKRRSARVGV